MSQKTKQYETEMDRKLHAHMILAEKKDMLWDLCQKFIDDQQIFDDEGAYVMAVVGPGLQNTELLIAIAGLVGYAK